MHPHNQNKLTLQQEQKSIIDLTEDRKFYNNIKYLLLKKNILTVSSLRIVSLFECLENHTIWIHMNFQFLLLLIMVIFLISVTLAHKLIWCLLEGSGAFRGVAVCWYKLSVVGLTFNNHSALKGHLI